MTDFSNETASVQIEFVQKILESCQRTLARSIPEKGVSDDIKRRLRDLRDVLADAIKELEAPTLKLAVIGTTSSGKSTLLNALMGRHILPAAIEQMSAGIVEIFHEDRQGIALEIDESDAGFWGHVNKTLHNSKEVYAEIEQVLKRYNKERDRQQMKAPSIKTHCWTLLGGRQDLLQLPPNVRLQLIDLPGIREMNDVDNLSVVQQTLKKTILINVLDYTHTSEQLLSKVLGEIKTVIEAFGNASSIFFVLNKIDARNTGDVHSIAERIEELQRQIAPMLKKEPSDVVIVPLTAIQLFNYACGSPSLAAKEWTDEQLLCLAEGIQKRSVNICEDWYEKAELSAKRVSNASDELTKGGSEEAKQLKRDNLTKALNNFRPVAQALSSEQRKQMIDAAWELSGCKDLVTTLAERVQRQLARMVLQPVTFAFQTELENILPILNEESRIALENSQDQLTKVIANLESAQKRLKNETKKIIDSLKGAFDSFITQLSAGDMNAADARSLTKDDEYPFLKPFGTIIDALIGIKSNATTLIFDEISRFFEDDLSLATLHSNLVDAGCSYNEVTTFVEHIKDFPELFKKYPDGEIKLDDTQPNRKYVDKIGKQINDAHKEIPNLLFSYFALELQRQHDVLKQIMREVASNVKEELYDVMIDECEIDDATAETLKPSDDFIAKEVAMPFSMKNLRMPAIVKVGVGTDKRTETHIRTWTEWWNGEKEYYIEETVLDHYVTLDFGTAREMVAKWDASIARAMGGLSAGIAFWVRENSDKIAGFFDKSFSDTIKGYEQVASEKIETGEKDYQAIEASIRSYAEGWNSLKSDDREGIVALENLYRED